MRALVASLTVTLMACSPSPSRHVSLQPLESCGALEQLVRERLLHRMETELDAARNAWLGNHCRSDSYSYSDNRTAFGITENSFSGGPLGAATGSPSGPAPAAPPTGEPNTGATSYSGTNNQVAQVDEADFIKNDARFFYVLADGHLQIIDAFPPETARVLGRLPIAGAPTRLFVEGGRAVVFARPLGPYSSGNPCTYGYDCQFTGEPGPLEIHFIDLADLTAPRITRTLRLSGSHLASRRVGTRVYTAVSFPDRLVPGYSTRPSDLEGCTTEADLPRVYAAFEKLRDENRRLILSAPLGELILAARDVTNDTDLWSDCAGFFAAQGDDGLRLTTVFSFDLSGEGAVSSSSMLGRPGVVYANTRSLYVAARQQTTRPETTAVHRFSLDGEKVSYAGSAPVDGHVLNQFSMDEHEGHLRIATSVGRVPDPDVHSVVTVLQGTPGALVETGRVGGIAPTEDIRSVRFVQSRGYLVTFKKTDPLFVLDLAVPTAPKVMGELKIPGFSTYMHPVGTDHLLAIGFEAEDHGSFAYFQGLQLQFFDVREPTEPRLLHKEVIGTRGSSSAAATDHLAFNYFQSRDLLALPMAICEGSAGGSSYGRLTFDGLLVYRASVEAGFTRLGGVAHGVPEDEATYLARPWSGKCSSWWSSSATHVQRSVFMDDVVYSVAKDVIHAQRLGALGTDVAVVSLEVP